jgi:hypothetical protein
LTTLIKEDCLNGMHRDKYALNAADKQAKRTFKTPAAFRSGYVDGAATNSLLLQRNWKAEETDLDLNGDIMIPNDGELVVRPGGKEWKVIKVMIRQDGAGALPIYMVDLTGEPTEVN